MVVVDSVVKLDTRRDGATLVYKDLLQQHRHNQLSTQGFFASPPTPDTKFYSSDAPVFFHDPPNSTVFKKQDSLPKRSEEEKKDDKQTVNKQHELNKLLNKLEDSIEMHAYDRLFRRLSTHPVYKNNLATAFKNFKLIRVQLLTLAYHGEADQPSSVVQKQLLLKLANSEAARHLDIIESSDKLKRAANIMTKVITL
jgi:hypothetical protein